MAYTTIDNPAEHFNTLLYTGDGESDRAITGVGFQSDWSWFKSRNQVWSHNASDSSRGSTYQLRPGTTNVEWNDATSLKSFDSDGFTVGESGDWNSSINNIVSWHWKANGGSRTTNAEDGNNPAGGYQANTTAGFSIVDYTGTGAAGTMAHGLGAAPDLIIIKNRDATDSWAVYHSANTAAPETDYLFLDTNVATADDDTFWNDTAPTSSVFTVTTAHNVNADAEKYMAYCFTSIQGYSKFGGYTGNGNADGPFAYTGFKPAWLVIKRTDSANEFFMWDNKRNTFNIMNTELRAGTTDAETTTDKLDFLSNGFKIRNTYTSGNADGGTYIYMAFAESPFVTSGGVPCTAR
jgi:hypothetical protein